jgi:hypothetical protein
VETCRNDGTKGKREGPGNLPGPQFVAEDLYMMIRHSIATYSLLCYLNADERPANDIYWNNAYGAVTAPAVRSMIDCLYNVTAILQDPAHKGPLYRKSGLRKKLFDVEEDQKRYSGRPAWDVHNENQLKAVNILIRMSGYTEDIIRKSETWPTSMDARWFNGTSTIFENIHLPPLATILGFIAWHI